MSVDARVAVAAAGGALARAQRGVAQPAEHLARRLHRSAGSRRSPTTSAWWRACSDGEPGYQLWAGGSLGTAPRLSLMLRPFVARADLWPAVWSIIEWFVTEGDVEQVAKGRLKFLVEARGETAFRAAFTKRFAAMRDEDSLPMPPPIDAARRPTPRCCVLGQAPDARLASTASAPNGAPGYASITVRVPLGDLLADDLVALAHARARPAASCSRASRTCWCRRCRSTTCRGSSAQLADLGLGPGRRAGRGRRARLPGPVVLLARHHREPAGRHRDRAGDQRAPGPAPRPVDRGVGLPELVHQAAGRRPRAVGHQGEGRRPGRARLPAVARRRPARRGAGRTGAAPAGGGGAGGGARRHRGVGGVAASGRGGGRHLPAHRPRRGGRRASRCGCASAASANDPLPTTELAGAA